MQRLSALLGHRVQVRFRAGQGSIFSIEVSLPAGDFAGQLESSHLRAAGPSPDPIRHIGEILVIEDDPEVRELLELVLKSEGHRAETAPDGATALAMVARGAVRPDLILADFNLPDGMDGLQVSATLRETLHRDIPVIILTGDISTGALKEISQQNCVQLNKPVKLPN